MTFYSHKQARCLFYIKKQIRVQPLAKGFSESIEGGVDLFYLLTIDFEDPTDLTIFFSSLSLSFSLVLLNFGIFPFIL